MAIQKDVSIGVNQDRAQDFITPVVVLRNAPEARFDTANNDWSIILSRVASLTVNDYRAIWPFAGLSIGGVRVISADS